MRSGGVRHSISGRSAATHAEGDAAEDATTKKSQSGRCSSPIAAAATKVHIHQASTMLRVRLGPMRSDQPPPRESADHGKGDGDHHDPQPGPGAVGGVQPARLRHVSVYRNMMLMTVLMASV